MPSPLHVVLGATGGVGRAVVQQLSSQGVHVRAVSRSGRGLAPGVEAMAADLMDRESTVSACSGATVVYHCAGERYDRWATALPRMLDNVLDGVRAARARLVYTDNLYMYAPTGQTLTEDSSQSPVTRKGKVRKQLAETILAAAGIEATIGRAPDFYGPGVLTSAVGEQLFGALVRGKRVPWLGKLDHPHALAFVDDFARGLIVLGAQDRAVGQVWHIPTAPPLTGREFIAKASEAAGVAPKPFAVPGLVLRLLGLTNPVMRESVEMLYEFDAPFLVDSSKFTRTFGGSVTPHEDALARTVAWYRAAGR